MKKLILKYSDGNKVQSLRHTKTGTTIVSEVPNSKKFIYDPNKYIYVLQNNGLLSVFDKNNPLQRIQYHVGYSPVTKDAYNSAISSEEYKQLAKKAISEQQTKSTEETQNPLWDKEIDVPLAISDESDAITANSPTMRIKMKDARDMLYTDLTLLGTAAGLPKNLKGINRLISPFLKNEKLINPATKLITNKFGMPLMSSLVGASIIDNGSKILTDNSFGENIENKTNGWIPSWFGEMLNPGWIVGGNLEKGTIKLGNVIYDSSKKITNPENIYKYGSPILGAYAKTKSGNRAAEVLMRSGVIHVDDFKNNLKNSTFDQKLNVLKYILGINKYNPKYPHTHLHDLSISPNCFYRGGNNNGLDSYEPTPDVVDTYLGKGPLDSRIAKPYPRTGNNMLDYGVEHENYRQRHYSDIHPVVYEINVPNNGIVYNPYGDEFDKLNSRYIDYNKLRKILAHPDTKATWIKGNEETGYKYIDSETGYEKTDYFRPYNGQRFSFLDTSGHKVYAVTFNNPTLKIPQTSAAWAQDFWKFHPDDFAKRYPDDNELNTQIIKLGAHFINKAGTPMIFRSKPIIYSPDF